MGRLWQVIGGATKGGILVRSGCATDTSQIAERLAKDSVVEEINLIGERLHYRLFKGSGPQEGWVTINLAGQPLAKQLHDNIEKIQNEQSLGRAPSVNQLSEAGEFVPRCPGEPTATMTAHGQVFNGPRFELRRINGSQVVLDMSRVRLVEDLRREAAEKVDIVVSSLKVLHDGRIIEDSELVSSLADGVHDTVIVDLVVVPPLKILAVTGFADKLLEIWDLESNTRLGVLQGHTNVPKSVSADFSAHRAVSGGIDGSVLVWDLTKKTCLVNFKGGRRGHSLPVTVVTADFGLQRVLSGSMDSTLRIWDIDIQSCLGKLDGHIAPVIGVSADFGVARAISASRDCTMRLWDLELMECMGVFEGHASEVSSVCADFESQRAVSGSADRTVRLWALETFQCIRVLEGHTGAVLTISVNFKLQRALSGSEDQTLRVWDLDKLACVGKMESGEQATIKSVHVDWENRASHAVGNLSNGKICVWNLQSLTPVCRMDGHAEFGVTSFSFGVWENRVFL